MAVIARGRYIRASSRKVGLVTDLIRGKKVNEAVNILKFSKKGSALAVLKVLNSAIANAKNNFDLKEEDLFVSTSLANSGPTMKRGRFASRGRWVKVLKRTTHITVGLSGIKDSLAQTEGQKAEVKDGKSPTKRGDK